MNLSHYGVIAVDGEDRRSFLQGQLSNDLESLSPTTSQLAALSNPQGRAVAVMRLVELDDAICLLLGSESVQGVLARLQRYVLRAKVTLSDHSNRMSVLGILDKNTKYIEKNFSISFPTRAGTVVPGAGLRVLSAEGDLPRWLLLTPADRAQQLTRELGWTDDPGYSESWRLSDLRAGLPVVHPQTQEMFLPQMLNLDLLGGISFTKGCYTGQEVIARTQNLGRIKRRMLRFSTEAGEQPMPGDTIYAGKDKAGDVVTATRNDGGWELLAVIKLSAHAETLSMDEQGQRVLTSLPLPYTIPELDT